MELGPPIVVDDGAHRILDVDVGAKDASVAEVTVDRLSFEVEGLARLGFAQVDVKLTAPCVLAAEAALAPLGAGRAVKVALARSVDLDRLLIEPPIDQVEVVRRLVDKEAAGIFLTPMPASIVVGAVDGIEKPREIDRVDPTDDALIEQLFYPGHIRCKTIVEGDSHFAGLAASASKDLRGTWRRRPSSASP